MSRTAEGCSGVPARRITYQGLHDVDFCLEALHVRDFFLGNHLDGSDDLRARHSGLEDLAVGSLAQFLQVTVVYELRDVVVVRDFPARQPTEDVFLFHPNSGDYSQLSGIQTFPTASPINNEF